METQDLAEESWESERVLSRNQLMDESCQYISANGSLKLLCRLDYFPEMFENETVKDCQDDLAALKKRAGDQVRVSVGTLLESKALSDLEIKTADGRVFQAHKVVLAGVVNLINPSYCLVRFLVSFQINK
jgi:hypothetical protein